MSMGLTKRQSETLQLISAHLTAHGRSPTIDKIRRAFGWGSNAFAHYTVNGLIERGHLRRVGRRLELVQSIGYDARDCFCDGCNGVRIRAHQTFIQALSEPAPILDGTNFKALGLLTRTCWRIGFPKPAHPKTRKPQTNMQPAQVGK